MRHATANRPSGARRPLAAAIAVAVITAAPVAAVGVNDAISALQQNGQYAADASHDDVMSAYTSIDKPGRLFLTNSGSSTSKRVPKGVVALPWKISASFTLNGPDVSVSDVSGASGMIGIRIALHATKPDVTANLTPIVAFTIPGRVGSDVTADDGVLVSSDNTSTLVAAVGKPGEDLTFNAYVTAKHFTMSSLSIAAVEGNVQQSLPDLTKRATTLVDGLTNVGSQRNRKLIAQLEQLRDNEKALAKQTIAVRSKAHDQAFDGYIDAYVGSYTTLSGWILDPDHKKMSKSKGNVVVPDKPIKQFGADAVRYWAAAARLGLDATYDEGQMKIGRRLAIKLLNATKFALAIGREDENHHVGAPAVAAWNPADVTEPIDRSAMSKMAAVVREATDDLNNYEHSKALEVIENYFWQFCDDYIELVKNRAYGTADSTGNVPSEAAVKSARTTLGLGLDAFARLLAPYLPYATEEVWSWMHEGEGSVHRAAWPVADVYAAAAGDASADLLAHAGEALAALRGIKSKAKVSMKTPILSVTLAVADDVRGSIEAALGDIAEAGRVTGPIAFTAPAAAEGEDEAADVTVAESELGEPPAKKPKK